MSLSFFFQPQGCKINKIPLIDCLIDWLIDNVKQTMKHFFLTRLLQADRWRQAVMTMESRSHQQIGQLEAKIGQNVNDVIQTQLEKIVHTEVKNVIMPR